MKCIIGFLWVVLLINVDSYSQSTNAYYIGHSLTDYIPTMVHRLSEDRSSVEFDWEFQSIPGSPLSYHWGKMAENNPNTRPHAHSFFEQSNGLPAGDFDALILTESVPMNLNKIEYTYPYADSFYLYAEDHNPDIQVYVYEIWHCLPNGIGADCARLPAEAAWRQKLVDDLEVWERVVDSLNSAHTPNKPVCMIPGGQGLIKLYDAVLAGELPGIPQMDSLFEDQIHLNDIGRYYIALIHFALLHNQNPQGLTNELRTQWGGLYKKIPTVAQAAVLQRLAWETVNEYPRTCLSGAAQSSAQTRSSSQNIVSSEQNSVSSSLPLASSGVFVSSSLGLMSSGMSVSSSLSSVHSETPISSLGQSYSSDILEGGYDSSFEDFPNEIPPSSEQHNTENYISGESNSILEISSDAGVAGLFSIQKIKDLSYAQFQQMLIRSSDVLVYDIMGRAFSLTRAGTVTMKSGLYIVILNGERFSFSHIK